MIPALLKPKPVVLAKNIGGQLFRIAGSADLDKKVVTVNVVPHNLTTIITEEMKTKIEEQIADEWRGYTIEVTYFCESRTYQDG